MRFNAKSVIIIAAILLLSIGFGFAFDGIATVIEKKQYPLHERYVEDIRATAAEYGIPEAILWATVSTRSNFSSSLEGKNGGIGLMQLTPEDFAMIQVDILGEDAQDKGLLYDPEKNLKYGAAYLSFLYDRYGVWETVFAAFDAGTEAVDAWLINPEYVSELGTLSTIPYHKTEQFVRDAMHAHRLYVKLYF